MDSSDLFILYQKQYYHEIEIRDKLNSRLQIPLAVLVAILGLLGLMLQNLSLKAEGIGFYIFVVFFILAGISTVLSIVFFRKSWFGHTDKLLPTAQNSEDYRKELIELYKAYDDHEKLVDEAMKKYLFDYYVEFSSLNTINNDSRSYHLYKTTVALTVATICTFLAFIPYQLYSLNKGTASKPVKVEIQYSAPIEVRLK